MRGHFSVAALLFLSLLFSPSAYCSDGPGSKGPLVTMELKDVELRDILRGLAQEHGLNIHVHEAVVGKATMSVRDMPLWEAMGPVLASRGYGYRVAEGGLYVVEPTDPALKEEQELTVGEFGLNYLKPDAGLMAVVKGLLSSRGRANGLEGSNTIVVKDIPLAVGRVEAMLASLDKVPVQVLIEARIVEVDRSFRKELGIEWGVAHSYTSGDVFGSLGKVDTSVDVNLPSSTDQGFSFGLGLVSGDVDIDIKLSALEDSGDLKVVSRPNIMVTENSEASIADGVEILIPDIDAATIIQTGGAHEVRQQRPQFLDAKLELKVTPRPVGGGRVALSVMTRKEEFDFTKEFEGFPPKSTRSASTEVVVRDGDTVVIGGIYKKKESGDESRVPFLWRLPVLGRLFKKETEEDAEAELMIFLTPHVVKEAGF